MEETLQETPTEEPKGTFIPGPCETALLQIIQRIQAEQRRMSIVNPNAKPQLDMFGVIRTLMRAVDGILALQLGNLDEIRDLLYMHRHTETGEADLPPIPDAQD